MDRLLAAARTSQCQREANQRQRRCLPEQAACLKDMKVMGGSDHDTIQFQILRQGKHEVSKTGMLDLKKMDLMQLKKLTGMV